MAKEETATTDPLGIRTVILIYDLPTNRPLRPNELNVEEVELVLRDLQKNDNINLILHIDDANYYGFYWKLRLLILKKKWSINRFKIDNDCRDGDNYLACLDFFIQFMLNNNATTHFGYFMGFPDNVLVVMQLERSRQLAEAIRSNNHGHIESFTLFADTFPTHEGIQLVWDSLQEMGIPDVMLSLKLSTEAEHINNNVVQQNFKLESFRTNTTLRKLRFNVNPSVPIDWTVFFGAIKMKQRLEFLEINVDSANFGNQEIFLVNEMLLENNSLTHVHIYDGYDTGESLVNVNNNDDIQKKMKTLLNVNRDWKKYRAMAAAVTVNTNTNANVNGNTDANANEDSEEDNEDDDDDDEGDDDDDANAENKILTFKKKTLVHMYLNKPIMRDTITFILLNEYKVALIHDANYNETGNEHGIFLCDLADMQIGNADADADANAEANL